MVVVGVGRVVVVVGGGGVIIIVGGGHCIVSVNECDNYLFHSKSPCR